jgi:tRNA (adenine22-N1)-methyltransferase
MIKLSRRLGALAAMIPAGSKIADIGTDHAFLPCYLVREGIVPYAVGVEVREGPFQAACRTVMAYRLDKLIAIRLGDGLEPLKPGEVDLAILAGMGGNTIVDILECSPQIVEKLEGLVLQPMNGIELVRSWLAANSWGITREELLLEDKHYYQIIKAVKGSGQVSVGLELYYGPLLLTSRNPLLPELIEKDIRGLQDIREQLEKSTSEEAQGRSQEIEQRIRLMKELKECLSAATP